MCFPSTVQLQVPLLRGELLAVGSRVHVLQVILVEADSLPLRDPEDLCKTAAFKQNGSLFWPGHWSAAQGDRPGFLDPAAYTLFGLEPPWVANPAAFATAETGQLLIDRHESLPRVLLEISGQNLVFAHVPVEAHPRTPTPCLVSKRADE